MQHTVSKVTVSPIKALKPRVNDNADIPYFNGTKFRAPDPDPEPDASFHRKPTFLTNLDVSNRNILNIDNYYDGSFDKESRKSKVSKFSVEEHAKENQDSIQDIVAQGDDRASTVMNRALVPYGAT